MRDRVCVIGCNRPAAAVEEEQEDVDLYVAAEEEEDFCSHTGMIEITGRMSATIQQYGEKKKKEEDDGVVVEVSGREYKLGSSAV